MQLKLPSWGFVEPVCRPGLRFRIRNDDKFYRDKIFRIKWAKYLGHGHWLAACTDENDKKEGLAGPVIHGLDPQYYFDKGQLEILDEPWW